MVLHFNHHLSQSLQDIQLIEKKEYLISENVFSNDPQIIEKYGNAKWEILEIINKQFGTKFHHYNWLNLKENDELAYFLNEAGSNCWNYSEHKAPHKLHLWLGEKGAILGIEQLGKGFNAEEINEKQIKENEGAAFNFFRKCKSRIFFDHQTNARIIYLEWKK